MQEVQFKRLEANEANKLNVKVDDYKREEFEKFLESKDNYAFVGIKDDNVIALVYGYGLLRPDGRNMFYIHSVDVIEELQSQGIGTKLMEFTLNYIKEEDKYYKYFVLTDKENIKACKLYQKHAKREEQVLFSNNI